MIRLVHVFLLDSAFIHGSTEHVRGRTAQWRFIYLPLHTPGVWFTGSIQKWWNNVNTLKEEIVFVFLVWCSVKLHLNINKGSWNLASWRTVSVCEWFSYLCFCVWVVSVFRSQSRPQRRINPCLNRCDQWGFSASLCHSSSPIFSVLLPPLPLLQVLSLTNTHFFLCYGLAGAHRASKQIQASSVGAGMDPHC